MKLWIRTLTIAALIAVAGVAALAQNEKPERVGSGNTASVGATSRIDAVDKRIGTFISGQEGLLEGTKQLIKTRRTTILNNIDTATGLIVDFNPQVGCDPRSDKHGCSCACSGPNQKLLWTGGENGKWQCYKAQQTCPTVPAGQKPYHFNAETCKCEICDSCPVLICEPPLVAIPTGTTTSCGGQGGECACISSGRRPGYGMRPALEPFIESFDYDSDNCPINIQCKNNLHYSEQRKNCCCDNGQSYLNGECGDVCPAGTFFQNGPHGGYATALGYCFTPSYRIVATSQECDAHEAGYVELRVGNNPNTCGGGDGICCERREKVPYTPFVAGEYMGCAAVY